VNAGASTQCVDHEPGIVGNRRQPGLARGMARFEHGVFGEGLASFLGTFYAEFGLGHNRDVGYSGAGQYLAHLAKLARIAAGKDTARNIR
jgi:hypothetical protein